jgi:hypothetical protein
MALKFKESCATCGFEVPAKTRAYWDAEARVIICLSCFKSAERPPEQLMGSGDSLSDSSTRQVSIPQSGVAGASALYRYQRLHERREADIDRRFGRFAGFIKFLADDPQSITAWAKGSEGERILAGALRARLGNQAIILNDRKVPRSSSNIDHLVIATTGVWIIDAKKYAGKVERRDVGGWFKVDNRVYVGGRDRTSLVRGMHRQRAIVSRALGDFDVPVHEVVCFVDAEWGWFAEPFTIEGVIVTWGKRLAEMIGASGPVTRSDVLKIATQLDEALPRKER